MKKSALLTLLLLNVYYLQAQIVTSDVSVEETNDITIINGDVEIGSTAAKADLDVSGDLKVDGVIENFSGVGAGNSFQVQLPDGGALWEIAIYASRIDNSQFGVRGVVLHCISNHGFAYNNYAMGCATTQNFEKWLNANGPSFSYQTQANNILNVTLTGTGIVQYNWTARKLTHGHSF